MSSKSEFYTVTEVAELLRISERHARQLIHDGHIPAARFGRAVRIHCDDLAAYIAQVRA